MVSMTSISNTIKNCLIIIFTVYISNVQSQRVYCGGAPGSTCACPGTSIPGSTCILDCSATDTCKGQTLKCRTGDPCEINCAGHQSCYEGTIVNGYSATDVKVTCLRDDSCSNNMVIHCGTGDCLLECLHRQSCQSWQPSSVSTFRAKSFLCYGSGCPHFQLPLQYSMSPTPAPTSIPTISPSGAPTRPTQDPTPRPTNNPSSSPTKRPTMSPTKGPTKNPSSSPTFRPTRNPTPSPTNRPTKSPTSGPTKSPTVDPTIDPTSGPTMDPTRDPTMDPTHTPSEAPTANEEFAAELLNSIGWSAVISVSVICMCCCVIIVCAIICCRKYNHYKEKGEEAQTAMTAMTKISKRSRDDINTRDEQQDNIKLTPESNETCSSDMQVMGGGISEIDLHLLQSLNAYNKQDQRRKMKSKSFKSTNGGLAFGEDKDKDKEFEIDPNLIGAFMFGGDTTKTGHGGEQEEEEEEDEDDYKGNFMSPFGDEPNELQLADSIDEMGSFQQRVKLMGLLQQQYELMNSYNMNLIQPQQRDHRNVDMGLI